MVTHTDRFCRRHLAKGGEEGVKEWGSWLRTPPCRVVGETQSRWLREEGDDTWEIRTGQDNNYQQNHGGDFSNVNKEIRQVHEFRGMTGHNLELVSKGSSSLSPAIPKGFNTTSNILFGLNEGESDPVQLEERKRRRGESGKLGLEDNVTGYAQIEPNKNIFTEGANISIMDLTAPTDQVMAELAVQASQHK